MLSTFKFRRTTYRVERLADSDNYLLPIRFILYSPRGRRYLLIPDRRRADRLVAITAMTHVSPYRPTPFGAIWFAVEDGRLVVAPQDS